MRILELFLLLSLIGCLICFFTQYVKVKKWLFYSSIVFFALHGVVEGVRWQMYLGYTALLISIALYYVSNIKKVVRLSLASLGLGIALLSVVLCIVMPVIKFPEPSGTFSVGLESLYLEDKTREETLTKEKGDYRKLTIDVYYPSDHEITKPIRYMDHGYAEAFVESKGMPSIIATHFDLTKTHTQKSLPILKKNQLPVIVLSHGLLWNSTMYTSIIEEIVSQGYVVFAIQHTYESFLSEYQGKRIKWSQKNIDDMNTDVDFGFVHKKMDLALNAKDERGNKAAYELIQYLPYFESLDRWSDDISFVIDQLAVLNEDSSSFLYQKLNMNQIGLLGHSWGGAAVVQNASVNKKIKGVINMDGAQFGRVIDTTLQAPLLVMHADRNYDKFFTPNFYVYDQVAKNDYYLVTIKSTGHANFGDLGYWSKIHSLTETGEIDPDRMSYITNQLILTFFNTYVKQQSLEMKEALIRKEYPEIEIIKK
ncbi:hypothetical protein ATO12_24565 [Aquimarina atlantica]|uniref:Carboxylic ester hydrolase n=1 Tax=Aquimarina atlantica TaxID=1317122 RepID=A0A023BR06_9FLAO|nr:hypothetical protein [Aquimarina atlantica]EZH72113.1 hypothetical protein ATO12_24565 [Aquimarina atlantica]